MLETCFRVRLSGFCTVVTNSVNPVNKGTLWICKPKFYHFHHTPLVSKEYREKTLKCRVGTPQCTVACWGRCSALYCYITTWSLIWNEVIIWYQNPESQNTSPSMFAEHFAVLRNNSVQNCCYDKVSPGVMIWIPKCWQKYVSQMDAPFCLPFSSWNFASVAF